MKREKCSDLSVHRCGFCGEPLKTVFVDLGTAPPSNSFLDSVQCAQEEKFYPLLIYVCDHCLLVQSPFYKKPEEIFNQNYIYHSSWSQTWVEHAAEYVNSVARRFDLGKNSLIVEIGSNDGYLLQHAQKLGIPCLGIDPSSGAAATAQIKGINTITSFFNSSLARMLVENGKRADLVCGINVFAHVPEINDFIEGIRILLKPGGIMTMEFPHLLRLMREIQFDTIYHEHYYYYSLLAAQKMLAAHDLAIFDVEYLPTHGGSLRIYAKKMNETPRGGVNQTPMVNDILASERAAELDKITGYTGFQKQISRIRHDVMRFLLDAAQNGKVVMGYGAAAKGNTLLNYFGIRRDLLPFVADASPQKQGKFLPGSRIPVLHPEKIREIKPDYLFVLAWNLIDEISAQHAYIRDWNGKFVTAIPELRIS